MLLAASGWAPQHSFKLRAQVSRQGSWTRTGLPHHELAAPRQGEVRVEAGCGMVCRGACASHRPLTAGAACWFLDVHARLGAQRLPCSSPQSRRPDRWVPQGQEVTSCLQMGWGRGV